MTPFFEVLRDLNNAATNPSLEFLLADNTEGLCGRKLLIIRACKLLANRE